MSPEQWLAEFHTEYLVRAGYMHDEESDDDLFDRYCDGTPSEAVTHIIRKYGMTDITTRKG